MSRQIFSLSLPNPLYLCKKNEENERNEEWQEIVSPTRTLFIENMGRGKRGRGGGGREGKRGVGGKRCGRQRWGGGEGEWRGGEGKFEGSGRGGEGKGRGKE